MQIKGMHCIINWAVWPKIWTSCRFRICIMQGTVLQFFFLSEVFSSNWFFANKIFSDSLDILKLWWRLRKDNGWAELSVYTLYNSNESLLPLTMTPGSRHCAIQSTMTASHPHRWQWHLGADIALFKVQWQRVTLTVDDDTWEPTLRYTQYNDSE